MNTYLTLHNKTQYNSKYLNEDIYNLLDNTFEIPSEFAFSIVEITREHVARPDLLSYDLYGDDSYADIICKLNGISNPFEFNEGEYIIVPQFSEITRFNITPILLENDEESNRPTPKQKNEKRKANETVIGDKRFTIDVANRVVIY